MASLFFTKKNKKQKTKKTDDFFEGANIVIGEGKAHFLSFLDNILDGVALLDFKGKILFFNASAARILEIDRPDDWLGQNIFTFLPDEIRTLVLKDVINVKIGKGGYLQTYKIKTAKGKEIYIENIGTSTEFLGRSVFVISFRDITQRILYENNLKEENQRSEFLKNIIFIANKSDDLNSLLDNILQTVIEFFGFDGGGVYLVDKDKKTATVIIDKNLPKKFVEQVRVVNTNKKPYSKIFKKGLPIIAENYEKFHPDNAKKFGFKSLASIPLSDGEDVVGALNIINKKRSIFSENEKQLLFSVGTHLGGAIKKAKQKIELKQSRARYKTIIDNTLDIVYSIDSTGIITFISPNVKFWGYTLKEVLGKNMFDFVHPEDVELVKKSLKKSLAIKKSFYTTFRLLKKSGKYIYAEEFGQAMPGVHGEFIGFSGVIRDVTERYNFIEQLKNYSTRLKIMFDNAPDPYYLSDLNGFLIDGNKEAEKFLGYKKEELIGKSFLKINKLLVAGQKAKIAKLIIKNKNGEPTGPDEFVLTKKNGEKIMAEITTHPVLIDGKKMVLGIARDITKRKKAEEELKYERDRNALYLNVVGVMIVVIGANGEVLSVNKKTCDILGYKENQIIGKNWFNKFIPPKYKKNVAGVFKKIISGKEKMLSYYENPVLTKDGQKRVIAWNNAIIKDMDGNVVASLSSGEDVTERKKMEEALASHVQDLEKTKITLSSALEDVKQEKFISEKLAEDLEKFKQAVDGASDHIIITDIDANIAYANSAAERTTGFGINEMIGKNPGKLWGGQMEKEYFKKMWKKIKTEKSVFKGELKNQRKNGEVYDAGISISPILDKKGNVMFFVGIEKDITEEKNIDRAKSEFIAIASHQLRTPLTGIKWYAELLLTDGVKMPDKQNDYIKKIYQNNQKMINLVKDLLDVSHIESGSKFSICRKNINLISVVKRAVADQMNIANQKRVSIKIIDLPKTYSAFVDGDKIYQALQNLIVNSIKYSKPNKAIEVGLIDNKKSFIVYVKDFGLGIPDKAKDKIFEKFFRADNAVKTGGAGTGLGLYIAKSIIEAHNGKIWFDSIEGKETTFYFELPKK